MTSLLNIRTLAAPALTLVVLVGMAGCGDEPDPAVANPQATAVTFIEAIRTGDAEAAEEAVLEDEDLAQAVAASTAARLDLEKAYSERFNGTLSDDPGLTLLRLAKEPSLVQEGNVDLQGDVALLDVGEGRQLRFELDDDAWKLDLSGSLGLEDDAVEQAIQSNNENAQKWATIAQNIRDGAYEDKDEVVSALVGTASGTTVADPPAGD